MNSIKWLNKLERKFGRIAIPNLMTILIFGMAIVAVIDIFTNPNYEQNLSSILMFDKSAILHGQIWRVLTFVFIPPGYSILTIAFTLYFYWILGTALESQWGSFRFNVYYFAGMIGTIIGGMIIGYATNYYLNLSLFLAYAMLYPNHQVYLFFILPIKIKYLAIIDALYLAYNFVFALWPERISILISILNFLVFFIPELWYQFKMFLHRRKSGKRKNSIYSNQEKPSWKNHWWDDHDNDPFH
ncbi:MAG: rhomboid family intramembrane serine protease [Oscillospiraceae bacterium]|nr:rhomboid family intramembrane serine protease [Oscillospiraceae bacterium]